MKTPNKSTEANASKGGTRRPGAFEACSAIAFHLLFRNRHRRFIQLLPPPNRRATFAKSLIRLGRTKVRPTTLFVMGNGMHNPHHRRIQMKQSERTKRSNMHSSIEPSIQVEPNLYNLLDACFASKEVQDEIRMRFKELANNESNFISSDRIQFSIIRLILENHKKGNYSIALAFDLAKSDWRDLLVATGHGNDLGAHNIWAKSIIQRRPRVVLEDPPQKPITIDKDGWTQCPTCNFKFKISDSNAWDGMRHRRCSQPLKIEADHRNI